MRRAKDGVPEPVFYQGQVVGETRRFSDTLAMFILKSKRREVWGERREIDLKHDWSNLTEAERVRKAMHMLDMGVSRSRPAHQPGAAANRLRPDRRR